MGIKKYKYYFRKPKSEIVKDVLYTLFLASALVVASSSPYFLLNIVKGYKKWKKYPKKKLRDTFYNLRRQGLIVIEKTDHNLNIRLTKEGRRRAGMLQIDFLNIKRSKKWDRKWRVIIFDICELKRTYRDLFRGKLKELGFYQLQKSVWICPFDCEAEIEILRDFFALSEKELRLIIAEKIENDSELRTFFDLT